MDYPDKIAALVSRALGGAPFSLDKSAGEIRALLETPNNPELGDHAFPCFTLAKSLKKPPAAIAQELVDAVKGPVEQDAALAGVAAVGPYLNFRVNKAHLAGQLLPAIIEGDFLAPRPAKHCRMMIEFSQPNTHKAFHVGHTRNVALGDACVRMCQWAGYDVVAVNYIGDVGAHIAKCLWYYTRHFDGQPPEENRGEFLGELYSKATELLDFSTLTRAPHPRVITAKVVAVEPHPANDDWKVVRVSTGEKEHQVVCGGVGYGVGDVVAYAQLGARINGRAVEPIDKSGVASDGMICAEKEVSLGEDARRIYTFRSETPLGREIAELMRLPAVPEGVSVIEEFARREGEVSQVLKDLEGGDEEIARLWERTRDWSLDEFHEIYDWLDVRFDHYFYESEVGEPGKKIVKKLYEDGVLIKSEGALGADLGRFKLPFFLLLKSDGTGLYSTKDMALARMKFEQFGVDRSVYVVDISQSLHFQQVFKTLELMGYDKARLCYHLPYGMVVLPGPEKMSSRLGNIILFSQLKSKLLFRLRQEYLDEYQGDWGEEEIADAAHRLAVATIKYGMLNQDNNREIVFDLEKWTERTGNTGTYLMYAYTRTQSILREVGPLNYDVADWTQLTHDMEHQLLRFLGDFPTVVSEAAEEFQPHRLCAYLFDLSKHFSRFFENCSVKKAENERLKSARAALVDATGRVLRKGLKLLGIQAVKRM